MTKDTKRERLGKMIVSAVIEERDLWTSINKSIEETERLRKEARETSAELERLIDQLCKIEG